MTSVWQVSSRPSDTVLQALPALLTSKGWSAPATSLLCTALWTRISPTLPLALWQPPPSALQPTGPSHLGNGPLTFLHQGFFSILDLRAVASERRITRAADREPRYMRNDMSTATARQPKFGTIERPYRLCAPSAEHSGVHLRDNTNWKSEYLQADPCMMCRLICLQLRILRRERCVASHRFSKGR